MRPLASSVLPLLLLCGCATLQPAPPRLTPAAEAAVEVLAANHFMRPQRAALVAEATRGGGSADRQLRSLLRPPLDRATRRLGRDAFQALLTDVTGGDTTGVGLPELLAVDVAERNGLPLVVTPLEGSPAALAGVRPGDALVRVGTVRVRELPLSLVVEPLRRGGLAERQLTLARGRKEFQVVLRPVERPAAPPVRRAMLGTTGYARVPVVTTDTPAQLREALEALVAGGARGVVLDLRNNPGGSLDAAGRIVGLFAGAVPLVTLRTAEGEPSVAAQGEAVYAGPLVVLVNEGTASAAEVIAGALQAAGRARLVGTPTFGKGLVHQPFPLPDGSTLLVSTARAVTPSGRDILLEGVQPDVERATPWSPVSLVPDAPLDADSQLQAGVAALGDAGLSLFPLVLPEGEGPVSAHSTR